MTVDDAKRELRRAMRRERLGVSDQPARSARLWAKLLAVAEVMAAERIMVFASIPGEPDTGPLIDALHAAGKQTALPEDPDLDPAWPDVIVVPGLAFATDGRRLGQGGGWYDRFLPGRRAAATTIGVCFAPQLLDEVPVDAHDVVLDLVLTD